jgi:CBS domain containing-hemolysin-like protein
LSETETLSSPPLVWPLIAGAVILLANGFFVAVEFALVASRRSRLEEAAAKGSRAASVVLHLLQDPDRAIAAAQVGISASSLLLGIVAEAPLSRLLAPRLTTLLGQVVGEQVALFVSALLVLALLSFFLMVLGEQTPKLVALRFPERTAQWLALPMQTFARLTAPFVWLVDGATSLVLRLLGVGGSVAVHGTVASLEELKALVRQSGRQGLLEAETQAILARVFELGETVVREIMQPRTQIIGIERGETVEDLLALFRGHRHSRFPVYEEDLDHIIGVVVMKDVLGLLIDRPEVRTWRVDRPELLQPALIVPESLTVSDLLEQMRNRHTPLAIVIDEFGGTAGLITMDEVVEAIIGRIRAEWAGRPRARAVAEHVFEVDGQMRIDELNEKLGLHLPEADDYETIAGLILYRLRHIPAVGEEVLLPDYRVRVLEMDGPRISKVQICDIIST